MDDAPSGRWVEIKLTETPGHESDLFHRAKSLSIPEATDSAGDDLAGAVLFPEQGRNREEANHYGARDMKVADSRNARPIEQILA